MAGAGRPAAERAGDPDPARGRRDRVAPAGGRGLAEPAGGLAAVADRLRLVPALAGAGPVRRPAARGGASPTAQGRPAAGPDAGHHRHAGGEVHRGARPARVRRRQEGARAQAGGAGRRRGALARGRRRAGRGAGPGCAGGAGRRQGALAEPAGGRLRRRVRGRALPRVVEPPRHAPPGGGPRPGREGLRRARPPLGGRAELRLAVALGRPRQGSGRPARCLRRTPGRRRRPLRLRGAAQPDTSPRTRSVARLKQVLRPEHPGDPAAAGPAALARPDLSRAAAGREPSAVPKGRSVAAYPSAWVLDPHPDREAVVNELHARPFADVRPPARVSHLAFLSAEEDAERDREHLASLCTRLGAVPAAVGARHHMADFGPVAVKWERHTEFSSYTFLRPGVPADPFADPALAAVPADWLAATPGRLLVAVHLAVAPAGATASSSRSAARTATPAPRPRSGPTSACMATA